MSARIDPATFDRLATDSTRARLTGLTVADLDRPATTTDWDIRTLLSHLVGGNIRFAQALRGDAVDWPTRDSEPVATPLAEFDATSADLAATIGGLSDPKRPVALAAGEPSAFFAVGVVLGPRPVLRTARRDTSSDPAVRLLGLAGRVAAR